MKLNFKGSGQKTDANFMELSGLHDAFTGQRLNIILGLHQCKNCQVFYHSESLTTLIDTSFGQCIACQSTQIQAINSYELDVTRTLDERRERIGVLPSVLLQSDLLATVDPLGEDWEKTKDE
ncbi:hypothetical protein CSB62_15485 [Vibrio splendidus]|nr:hypothetical protein CSB62_15485 [Vibrio splendidus]